MFWQVGSSATSRHNYVVRRKYSRAHQHHPEYRRKHRLRERLGNQRCSDAETITSSEAVAGSTSTVPEPGTLGLLGTGLAILAGAAPEKTAHLASESSRQPERIDRAARRDRHILFSVDRKCHGRGIDRAAHLEMPERLARRRIEGDEVSFRVAAEHQAASG